MKNHQHLRYVDISQNNISDVNVLYQLPYVIHLQCQENKIKTIDPLSNEETFQYLQYADFSTNRIKSFPAIKQPKLKQLNLNNNKIDSAEHFVGHPTLQVLKIRGNKLSGLTGLKEMPALTELYLPENQIASIVGLENLPSLKKLQLRKNLIEGFDEEAFPDLPSLETLSLRENPLSKIEEVRKLNRLPNLSKLNLKETGLAGELADKMKIEVL